LNNQDILVKMAGGVFSFRVSVLLFRVFNFLHQRKNHDSGYSFPGGHVSFGEVSTDTIIREFKEEIGIDITPSRLLWIGEIFFPWAQSDCHQISLYYQVIFRDETQIPSDDDFFVLDEIEEKRHRLLFTWIDLSELENIDLYPIDAKKKLLNLSGQIEHFIYRESH
jgi:8-oxo-dGTP pyrophosphatase MutT (NUDIX family)